MAPIYAAAVGVNPQIIDDERLRQLRDSILSIDLKAPLPLPLHRTFSTPEQVSEPLDIERLVEAVEPWQTWVFEEQVSSTRYRVSK
jgi:hypothetical protein